MKCQEEQCIWFSSASSPVQTRLPSLNTSHTHPFIDSISDIHHRDGMRTPQAHFLIFFPSFHRFSHRLYVCSPICNYIHMFTSCLVPISLPSTSICIYRSSTLDPVDSVCVTIYDDRLFCFSLFRPHLSSIYHLISCVHYCMTSPTHMTHTNQLTQRKTRAASPEQKAWRV